MSRRIEDMHPKLQDRFKQFLAECERLSLDVLITCTHRTNAEQDALYAQGRTKPGPIVTRAKAGQSKHNHYENGKPASLAFDIVPMRDGKPVWGTGPHDLPLWKAIANVAKRLGFSWYGEPDAPFREFPHLEWKAPL